MVNLTRHFFSSDELKTKTLKAIMQIVNNVFKICVESERCNELKINKLRLRKHYGGSMEIYLGPRGIP